MGIHRRPTAWLAIALLLLVASRADATTPPAAGLDRLVAERLAAFDPLLASRVEVAVSDGAVLLRGVVRLYEDALQAERIAWTTPGVADVENELRVVPALPVTDEAIERDVREILKTDPAFIDVSVRVAVEAGFVGIKGLFQDPSEVLALKHRVATVPGVLHVAVEAMLIARRGGPAAGAS